MKTLLHYTLFIVHSTLALCALSAQPAISAQPGLKLHLDAASAVVGKDGAVTALRDQGPLKLRVNARLAGKAGGFFRPGSLNGHPTITLINGGFLIDGKNAAALNASDKGFSLALVAKLNGPPSASAQVVRKQGDAVTKETGYRVLFEKSGNLTLWAVDNENNRRSYGIRPAPDGWFVLVMSADIAAGRFDIAINGQLHDKPFSRGSLARLSNDSPFEIGVGPHGAVEFAELAFHDRPFTASEQKSITDALADKYALRNAGKPLAIGKPLAFATAAKLEDFLGKPVFIPPQKLWDKRGGWGGTVSAPDGAMLVFQSPGGGACKRSLDGGRTWGPDIVIAPDAKGGRALVDETTGHVLYAKPAAGWFFRSADSGATWTRETCEARPDGFGLIGKDVGAMQAGITLAFGPRKGRLIMPARITGPKYSNAVEWRPYHYSTALYSDDGGRVWQTSKPFPVMGTGEATLAELSDGSILYNSREHMSDGNRFFAWSHDGGELWLNASRSPDLPDGPRGSSYGCMGGMVRLPVEGRDILLYSNLDSDTGAMPARVGASIDTGRQKVTVWASFDGGRTWPVKRLVYDGPSAYSNLGVGRSGTPSQGLIFLTFEGGATHHYESVQVAAFNLSWLLDGREMP